MPRSTALLMGFALVVMLWLLEFNTPPEIGFSIFFIIPIGLVVWRVGGPWNYIMPIVCSIAWYTAEAAEGRVYSHWEYGCWNALVRLGFFSIFSYMLIILRRNLVGEKSSREQAEEVSRLKSNMIGLVSHEYGNVLTHLKLSTFLLRESEPAPVEESRAKTYEMLGRAIEHLRTTTANFLNLNRLESGQLQLHILSKPVNFVASETLNYMQPLIDAKHLSLKLDLPPAALVANVDSEALALIMSNLITNAIKYTKAGTITVRVAEDAGPPARVLFSVQDTGIGIPAADLDRVLTGFRTKESQKVAKGFGIGLKLIKELIERHGSHLQIESELGKGSRFFFYLPVGSHQ